MEEKQAEPVHKDSGDKGSGGTTDATRAVQQRVEWIVITDERKHEYRRIKHSVFTWSGAQPDIEGIAIVGPWARRAADMDSHLDLLVLTRDRERYLQSERWVSHALPSAGEVVRTEVSESMTECQVRLPSGLVVEFGFTSPSWASVDPVDPVSARVAREGCIPLVDTHRLFERFLGTL